MKSFIFATAFAALLFFFPNFLNAQQLEQPQPSVQVFPFQDSLANTFSGYVLDSATNSVTQHYRHDKLNRIYFWLLPEKQGVFIKLYDYDAGGNPTGQRQLHLGRDKKLGWFTYSKVNVTDLHAFLVEAVRRFNQ